MSKFEKSTEIIKLIEILKLTDRNNDGKIDYKDFTCLINNEKSKKQLIKTVLSINFIEERSIFFLMFGDILKEAFGPYKIFKDGLIFEDYDYYETLDKNITQECFDGCKSWVYKNNDRYSINLLQVEKKRYKSIIYIFAKLTTQILKFFI